MSSTIVLNQSNIVNAENNTFVYKFPNSVQFPNHQIAIQSASMYYSWQNINSIPLDSNTINISYYRDNVLSNDTITIPNGLYEITDINTIPNGKYLNERPHTKLFGVGLGKEEYNDISKAFPI